MPSIPRVTRLVLPSLALAWSCTANFACFAADEPSTCIDSYTNLLEAVDATLKREADNDWQKIKWETNAAQALKRAQRENKPIFIFFLDNEKIPQLRGET